MKVLEGIIDGLAVFVISNNKQSEVISKEKVGYVGITSRGFERVPQSQSYFDLNISRQSFHAKDKEVGGHRSPYLLTLLGINYVSTIVVGLKVR